MPNTTSRRIVLKRAVPNLNLLAILQQEVEARREMNETKPTGSQIQKMKTKPRLRENSPMKRIQHLEKYTVC